MLAITVSRGRSRPAASWARVADLPIPGSPHNRTGRLAATVRASASAWALAAGSVRVARVEPTSASASSSWLLIVARLVGELQVVGVAAEEVPHVHVLVFAVRLDVGAGGDQRVIRL